MTYLFPGEVRLFPDRSDRTAHLHRSRILRAAASSLPPIPLAGRILLGALVLSLAALTAPAQVAESTIQLASHTPPQVLQGDAIRLDHYGPDQNLRLALAIKPPHLAEEEAFLRELTDKKSPKFHKFLTPEEWNARFAPSSEDEQKVVAWAESQGLTVTKRYSHRLIVDLEAPAGVIEKAFGVTINKYQVGEEVDFSNDRDPVLPASLSGLVYSVQGLNNIQRDRGAKPESNLIKAPDYLPGPVSALGGEGHKDGDSTQLPSGPRANNGPVSNVTGSYIDPSDLYNSQIYDYDGLQHLGHCCNPNHLASGSPNVSSIAIAGFGQFLPSDISGFVATYPYLAYNYNYYYIDGTPFCGNTCATGETTEDVEYTIATSNSFGSYLDTAHVYVYLGGNGNNSTYTDIYSHMLNDNTARVMSTSWSCTEIYGCPTSTMDSRHNIFNSMVGQGWTLIAASGDRGASDDCNTGHSSVAYPGSDFDVLAAGGTSLQVYYPPLLWDYENGWQGGTYSGACGQNNGGSGGGISAYYGKPYWQNSFGGTQRLTPDLSLNALGVGQNLYINGGLNGSANGTSVVAPELAGFSAQENAYLLYIGNKCGSGTSACAPMGNMQPWIYEEGVNHNAGHIPFYDITSGCNSNDITAAGGLSYYCAHSGYDLVTGWGSANMMQLAWAINWEITAANGTPYTSFSGPATSTWYKSDQVISWTIVDYNGGGSAPGTGIAGFTQGWDSIPADPTSEPHGGSGNSFYSGPQYANTSTGCLSFNGGSGCAGGSGQGCHTVHVRGWNNQGWTTGDTTFGPLCYDTVAPTISVSNSPIQPSSGWWNGSVQVTLTPTDSGGSKASGIYKTYYAINTGSCVPGSLGSCSVYTGPFTISGQQQSYIYYFTEDNAGNFSTETYEWVSIDLTAPTTTASLGGTVYSGSVYKTAVNVTLNASDTGGSGPKNTYYQLDGGSTVTYSGAFGVSALGSHSVKYWSVDSAGNVESAKTSTFSISTPTTASLVATPNPSLFGQLVKMTATVTATLSGTPTGSVTFWNGATNLGTGTLSGGVASLSTTALPAGVLTLQVSYAGSGNFLSTNSAPFDQTVEKRAALTSPAAGTVLTGPKVTFSWTTATGATGYKLWIGTTKGAGNLYTTALSTATSATPTSLPTNGETIYVRLWTNYNSSWVDNDYTYTATTQAAMISPAGGTVLTGPKVPFSWTAANGATGYQLWIGTTKGGINLYKSGQITALTATPTSLPTNGETIYVRLWTSYNSINLYTDYTYTASTQAVMISPAGGTVLTGPKVTFSWTTATGVTGYQLWIGTTKGAGNLYTTGLTTATSATPTSLPTNGETIYVRLGTNYNSTYVYADYTYTAATQAALISPAGGTVLTGPKVPFSWTAATGVTGYQLWIGTTKGAGNLYTTGLTTATSATPTSLPTNGETIYVRLWTDYNGTYVYADYTYTTATQAALISPAGGTVLTGPKVPFSWTAANGVTGYQLWIGTTKGAGNLYTTGLTTATSATPTNLPTNGETIYVRLWTDYNSTYVYADYTYTAYTAP